MIRVLSAVLAWIVLINLQPAAGIVNRKRNSSSTVRPQFYPSGETYKRKSYLQSNRPLWVLEDNVNRPGEINMPSRKPAGRIKAKRRLITPVTPSSILPNHYKNLSPYSVMNPFPRARPRNRQNSRNQRVFPVFEDYGTESDPILIYRGPKAKMIFNTMMSSKKYPMQEPVPGQILYPPYSPKFKPTPVVERVALESEVGNVNHNLTLIPFYTHEAAVDPRLDSIDPAQLKFGVGDEVENANAMTEAQSTRYKEECHNCYHSYYSQNDVQSKYWSMPYITPSPESTTPMNLRQQIEVPNGIYSNQRVIEETTPIPPALEEPFRITYDSEIQNRFRNKRYRSVLSAKYSGFKTVYPIYTLNKLLRYKPFKNKRQDVAKGDMTKRIAPEETWLIWNSRSREAHKSNYLNSISIKDMPKNHKMSRMIDHKIMIK